MGYDDWAWPKKRNHMTVCAINALEAQGYKVQKVPGRGLSSIWTYENGEDKGRLAIRTSQDTWFAFPRHSGGWKTLDSVDKVVVAAVDHQDAPENIEVYLFSADEVRKCFNASRKARIDAGMIVKDDYGMWIKINVIDHTNYPQGVGSGLGDIYPAIATEPLSVETADDMSFLEDIEPLNAAAHDISIVDILDAAKLSISQKLGVPKSHVVLEMRLGM